MFRLTDPRIAVLAVASAIALAVPAGADASMVFPDGDIVREGLRDSGATVTWRTPTVDFGRLRGTPNCTPDSGSAFPTGTAQIECLAVVEVCPPLQVCHIQLVGGRFNVTVTRGQGPSLTGLSDRAVAAESGRDSARVDYALPVAADPAGVAPGSVACAPPPGSEFALGDTNVTCSARDTIGNESSATFRVNVFRPEPPAPGAPSVPALPAPADPAAPGPDAPSASGPAEAAAPSATRAVAIGRRLRISRGVARLAVSCPKGNPVGCRGTLRLEDARKRRLGAKRISLAPGRKATVRIRLSGAARRALSRGKRIRVRAIARTSDQSGRALTGARTFRIGAR